MIRNFNFYKFISCHSWKESEYADNLLIQLRKTLLSKKNFELKSDTLRWKGKSITISFTEFFEDVDINSTLEKSRISEMFKILLDKGFSKIDELSDESQIRDKQNIKEKKRFGQANPLSKWEEDEFNEMINFLKGLQSKEEFMKSCKVSNTR